MGVAETIPFVGRSRCVNGSVGSGLMVLLVAAGGAFRNTPLIEKPISWPAAAGHSTNLRGFDLTVQAPHSLCVSAPLPPRARVRYE